MSDRARTLATVALVGALVVVSSTVPAVTARPAHEIPVVEVEDASLTDPDADGWQEVPASDVPLSSAPSRVPNADDTTIEQVHVQAATDGNRVHIRLQWSDATRDADTPGTRSFADAAAIQLPVDQRARPPIAMGGSDNMVNVWYWNAETGEQELLAGGAGSTTPFQRPAVTVSAVHRGSGANATWTVVYSRNLSVNGENRTSINAENDIDVAFAVWNGSNAERSGQKAISEWHYFPFGPGPQGPPYETILWSVAGIAIVAIVGVTAIGVYRTGGGME